MREYRYIKIPYCKAEELGLTKFRTTTADGCVLINESDLNTYVAEGDTLEDKAASLGGKILSNLEARKELHK
jgi:hypothetical protein